MSQGRTNVRTVHQQLSFADLDDPDSFFGADGQVRPDDEDLSLFEATLVVVDLETTGGSPVDDRITEIGAVKIRGGEVVGEFATLVDPGMPIPPHIVSLTGITEAMVHDAPCESEALLSFLEFARGAVLVAHNARFDIGFLRRGTERLQVPWTFPAPLCTVTLARRILSRDEAPSVRLSALAELFDVTVRPTHRALDDARATVEVLHRLLERVGNQGVRTIGQLTAYRSQTATRLAAKRHLADALPTRPGVYLFRGPADEVLYVGTAVNLRRRVLSYFAGTDPRRRIDEMVRLAVRVDHVECAHGLEAGVRELRLLAAHAPAYNRRSTQPRRGWWLVLSDDRFPRLTVRRAPTDDAVGPFSDRSVAAAVADLISAGAGLRTCTALRRGATHHWCRTDSSGRMIGGCRAASPAPLTPTDYAARVMRARAVMFGESDDIVTAAVAEVTRLAAAEMFESAARQRDRTAAMIHTLALCQRLRALCVVGELVVARPHECGGWELSVIRHGRLAGAGVARRGVPPMPVVQALVAAAETVAPDPGPLCGAPPEEAGLIYRWITDPGARIVSATDAIALPAFGAARSLHWARLARQARR
ncbi:DEDD exonuclease domain-containing protein [Gordonia pseudamarae]|uniref:DEDD exonuclease domain-containing protein n=1 Tax=Gordonia pseudamarae TaxID=2831662 RepID=A0ABX6IJA1_9ACTN|nr:MULTISPECIES: DEDD exonuclease domain-containing protein [Gordonia]MBD0022615.1 DEDD exonuclease domain-containing protein [Gordonia sp. (in: high G+C Gram-positive bacteria)]QHN26825.1 DEDD exonuclease domain-containing protein [Gordonia pseudamarae]QHN35716.1 DEDD exonuclease domain-containing protein [Gordonia pseudamarae]